MHELIRTNERMTLEIPTIFFVYTPTEIDTQEGLDISHSPSYNHHTAEAEKAPWFVPRGCHGYVGAEGESGSFEI